MQDHPRHRLHHQAGRLRGGGGLPQLFHRQHGEVRGRDCGPEDRAAVFSVADTEVLSGEQDCQPHQPLHPVQEGAQEDVCPARLHHGPGPRLLCTEDEDNSGGHTQRDL